MFNRLKNGNRCLPDTILASRNEYLEKVRESVQSSRSIGVNGSCLKSTNICNRRPVICLIGCDCTAECPPGCAAGCMKGCGRGTK
ncbi:hypothetical protein LR013_01555 [candidate division NPL-UPA2 bacterium]|nr:hypothetical protein [candidate division NPL-UPA2 bacterium]